MDLPTYTNIWRIEKRLYKLYDFRLPMPLPISWIAVFCGITVPYVVALAAIGVPFDHTLLWLYVLPPGVLTWLTTRPVLENKRLPELLVSQLRYLGEPRTWCRLVPLSEKNDIRVYARVWHRPAGAAAPATDGAAAMAVATTGRARAAGTVVAPGLAARIRPAGKPATEGAGPVRGTQRTWRDGRGRQDLPLRAASAGPPSWPYAEMGTRSGQAPARARGTSAPARADAGPAAPRTGRAGTGYAWTTGCGRTGRARTGCAWTTACAWANWAGTGSPCPGRLDGTGRRILTRVVARGPAPCDPGSGTSRASDDRSRLWRLTSSPPGGSRRAARRPCRVAVRWPQRSGHRTAAHRPAHRGLARDAGESRPSGGPALGPARSP